MMSPATPWAGRLPPVLRNRIYRRYWLSQVVSLTGTWMQQVAMGWVVLTLTTSALAIGAVSIVGSLPLLLLSLSGGVAADRHDRRRILILTQSTLAVLAAIVAILVAFDVVAYWQIILLSILGGIAAAFEIPASQAFVPELVDQEELPQAVALNAAAFNGSRLVGPAIAGVAIATLGLASAFVANAVSFLAVIGVLLGMRGRPVTRREVPARAGRAMREGLSYVRGQRALLGLIGVTGITTLLVFPSLAVLMPLYVTDVLDAGPAWLGIMMSSSGFGSLIGSLALLRGAQSDPAVNRRIRVSIAGMTAGLLAMAIVRNPFLAIPAVILLSFSMSIGIAQIQTRVQQVAPDAMRGRVMSIYGLAFTGVMPVAILLVSGLAQVIGQPATLLITAIAYALGATALYRRFIRVAVPVADPDLTVAASDLADAA